LEHADSFDVGFAIGWNSERPSRVIPIVELAVESTITGGLTDLGSDVAIAHLGSAVRDVDLYSIAPLSAADVGRWYAAVGYGSQNLKGDSGTRKAGLLTLRSLEGSVYEASFGTYDEYLRHAADLFSLPPEAMLVPEIQLALREEYDGARLLPGYEAMVGNARWNAQVCHGDSGGPLVGVGRKIYGVASWVLKSNGSTFCQYGSVYAIFGEAATAFVQHELEWTDACEGIDTKGVCMGDEAVRCTNSRAGEGERQVTRTDCSILGQRCSRTPGFQVSCVD
jgi:hypothetical protein